MSMLRFHAALSAAMMALALAAGVSAQEYPGKRIRPQHLIENWPGSPEAYLTEACVVLRSFEVDASTGSLQITGKLWSDFEVESGHGAPGGQLMGLEVEVTLHELASDMDSKNGQPVPGQTVTCRVNSTEDVGEVKLGTATFALPALAKPLPPGSYRLVCKAPLARQPKAIKDALMWVPNLYGIKPVYDDKGTPTGESTQVYKSKDHKAAWQDLSENEVCKSEGTLFLGNVVKGNSVKLDSKSLLCRNPSFDVYKNLAFLSEQRELLDKEYALNKANPNLNQKEIKASYDKSLEQLEVLTRRAGGKMDSKESSSYQQMLTAMNNLRAEIIRFEDDLTLKYWILLDTFYYAFHSINKVGYNCSTAIEKNNNQLDRDAREQKQDALKRDPAALKTRDETRENNFRYIPEPIKKAAFEYYRRSEEVNDFDSATYTRKAGKTYELDPAKWSAFRVKFLADFRKASDAALLAVDVSQVYAIQKWGEVYRNAVEVRDSIITHAYCYEYYLRMLSLEKAGATKEDKKALDDQIVDEWKTEAGENVKRLEPYFPGAKAAPSAVYGRFEAAHKQAKSERLLDMADFAYRFRWKIEKQTDPPAPRRYKFK